MHKNLTFVLVASLFFVTTAEPMFYMLRCDEPSATQKTSRKVCSKIINRAKKARKRQQVLHEKSLKRAQTSKKATPKPKLIEIEGRTLEPIYHILQACTDHEDLIYPPHLSQTDIFVYSPKEDCSTEKCLKELNEDDIDNLISGNCVYSKHGTISTLIINTQDLEKAHTLSLSRFFRGALQQSRHRQYYEQEAQHERSLKRAQTSKKATPKPKLIEIEGRTLEPIYHILQACTDHEDLIYPPHLSRTDIFVYSPEEDRNTEKYLEKLNEDDIDNLMSGNCVYSKHGTTGALIINTQDPEKGRALFLSQLIREALRFRHERFLTYDDPSLRFAQEIRDRKLRFAQKIRETIHPEWNENARKLKKRRHQR